MIPLIHLLSTKFQFVILMFNQNQHFPLMLSCFYVGLCFEKPFLALQSKVYRLHTFKMVCHKWFLEEDFSNNRTKQRGLVESFTRPHSIKMILIERKPFLLPERPDTAPPRGLTVCLHWLKLPVILEQWEGVSSQGRITAYGVTFSSLYHPGNKQAINSLVCRGRHLSSIWHWDGRGCRLSGG